MLLFPHLPSHLFSNDSLFHSEIVLLPQDHWFYRNISKRMKQFMHSQHKRILIGMCISIFYCTFDLCYLFNMYVWILIGERWCWCSWPIWKPTFLCILIFFLDRMLASGLIATPTRHLCALPLLVYYMQCTRCSRYKAEFEGLWLPSDCGVYLTQLHGDQGMYY